jgi:uncharacterized iron-regulated membrane protein
VSLVLGLALLVISTSGAILLYGQSIHRMLNADAYNTNDGPAQISFAEAREVVEQEQPDFVPVAVYSSHGVLSVTDYETAYNVDPTTGDYLGVVEPTPIWLEFVENLHYCFLSCEGPGYVSGLAAEVPGTAWLGFDGLGVTYGSLALLIVGIMMVYLVLTGLWLWVPRPSRWKSAITVRWRRGRFARDTDLHKITGMIALPLLLIWGVTGASYESELISKAWYAATPGSQVEGDEMTSAKGVGRDIGIAEAISSAQTAMPQYRVVGVDMPLPRGEQDHDPAAVYMVWMAKGFDTYGHSNYPGTLGVSVDRRSGEAEVTFGTEEASAAQHIWDNWNYPTHAGFVVNGWWRIVWLIMGLAPLLLAVTGVSTWLVRRRTKQNRRLPKQTPAVAQSGPPAT